MAVNTPTLVTRHRAKRGARFAVNSGAVGDASTAVALKAAAGAGKCIHLDKIILQSDDADAHPSINDGASVLFGPLASAVEGPGITWEAGDDDLIQLTANSACNLKAAAAGNVWAYVSGYVDT